MDPSQIELAVGGHETAEEGMCVMEAVAYVAGEQFSDHPRCASYVIAAYMRGINDGLFADRLDELVPYVPRLVATAAALDVEVRRALLCADYAVRRFAPVALEAAGLSDVAASLRALPAVDSADAASTARDAVGAACDAVSAGSDFRNGARFAANGARYAASGARYAASGASNAARCASNAPQYASDAARFAGGSASDAAQYAASGGTDTIHSIALELADRLIAQT